MTSHIQLLQRLNLAGIAENAAKKAYALKEQKIYEQDLESSPHGSPWHTSFHASQFPGDPDIACGRKAMYGLMNIPNQKPFDAHNRAIMDAGKALEYEYVSRFAEAGMLISVPPDSKIQTGFKNSEFWLTGNLDAVIQPEGWDGGHVVEIKGKDHSVIDDMKAGRRSYDKPHLYQLQCYLGFLQDPYNLKLLYSNYWLRSNEKLKAPINTGSILYVSRQRPRHTHEFVFDFDQAMWDEATDIIAKWKQNFIDGELPERFPWRWTETPCQYCEVKKLCKLDYKAKVDRLENSNANTFAKKLRPKHDYKKIHKAVLKRWEK